jgi:glycosyltransferase XagB
MSAATDLIAAILVEDGLDEAGALDVLTEALEREVDPLRYCASTLGVDERLVMERAARWADLAFYPVIPRALEQTITSDHLDTLAEARSVPLMLIDRPVVFAAPDFFEVLSLRSRRLANPRFRNRICIVPDTALRDYLVRSASSALVDAARQGLAQRWPLATAHLELTAIARYGFIAGIGLLVGLVLIAPYLFQLWLLPLVLLLLLGPSVVRIAALMTPRRREPAAVRPDDAELPAYTVLVPLRDEATMVPQLFEAMRSLDYPAERLDVVFVVEQRSAETLDAVRQRLGDARFSLIEVPDALPRTKPKALDYALPLCRGEFVVVYDAEDIPDPDQLWRAAVRFRDEPDVECLQARLVIDNGRRQWLAALFAGEYAGLFAVLLPALARWRLPMPLGGTSNHFRLSSLRQLGGWDAYNVTEDADIGVRLARLRLRVDVLDSATREAAPTRIRPWLGQRTRWMKGWMQTFIVHNRNPRLLARQMGLGPMLVFELLVLGMITAPLLHTGFLAVLVSGSLRSSALLSFHDGWSSFYVGVLILGYGSATALTLVGLHRTKLTGLAPSQLMLPLYWLLMAWATVRATVELATRPFFWFKSPHQQA